MTTVKINSALQDTIHGHAQVTADSFGQIYTTFQPFGSFWNAGSSMSAGHIRWPGGSLAENKSGQDVYHLTNAEVHSHNVPEKGITNLFEQATELDLGVSIILPTRDYYLEGSTDYFTNDLNVFFDRLTHEDGFYDVSQDFLDSGSDVMLEIGNETWFMGYGDWSYGNMAYEALATAKEHAEVSEEESIKFAVQSGSMTDQTGLFSTKLIINNLDGATSNRTGGSDFAEKENVLDQIDALVNHDGLVAKAEDFSFADEKAMLDEWKSAMGEHWNDVELYASAWGVGRHSEGFGSLEGAESDELADYDLGARQGTGTLDVFAKLSALGYDSAALWGVVNPEQNASSYLGQDPDDEGGFSFKTAELSHGGEVVRMMTESLQDTRLLAGNVDPATGEWSATYHNWDTKEGDDALNTYSFANASKFVIFASVTDLDGQRYSHDVTWDEGPRTHTFDVSDLHDVDFVTVEALRTEFDFDAWRTFKAENPEYTGAELQAYRRLFEKPEIHRETIEIRDDGTFDYSFTDDFEVVRFVGDTNVEAPAEPVEEEAAEDPTVIDPMIAKGGAEDAEPQILVVTGTEAAQILAAEAIEGGKATVEGNEVHFAPEEGFTGEARVMYVAENAEGEFETFETNVSVPEVMSDDATSEETEAAAEAEQPTEQLIENFNIESEVLELDGYSFGTEPGQTDPRAFLASNGEIEGSDLVLKLSDDMTVRLTNIAPEDDMPMFPEDLSAVFASDKTDHAMPTSAKHDDAADDADFDGLDLGDGQKIKFVDQGEDETYTPDHEVYDEEDTDDQFDDVLAGLGFLF